MFFLSLEEHRRSELFFSRWEVRPEMEPVRDEKVGLNGGIIPSVLESACWDSMMNLSHNCFQ